MQHETYIIGEIGQNHNGSIELAKKLIDMIAMPIYDSFSQSMLPGINAVKFTKRDLSEELSREEAERLYDSPHSFGRTYGEHRAHLEFDYDQYPELERYTREKGLEFVVTLCSPETLRLLDYVTLDRIKVASRDLTNIPLLERIAETRIPVILSTGMSGTDEIDEALDVIARHHSNIAVLHCISEYPAQYRNVDLRTLETLRRRYGDRCEIGYSDHSIGIMVPVLAVGLGATIVEKHVTLSRAMKGSDHAGSLEMDGVWRMVRDIRNAEQALGSSEIRVHEAVHGAMTKLRRSVALKRGLEVGDVLTEEHLTMLSPGTGMAWRDRSTLIGRKARRRVPEQSLLTADMFE
ncbi:shikimate dehydrogenase [candidate division GN15 bacterium]|nr:shikimate dehydrogenase [candidate division GN15 bacterium]